jgi:hypothetical protein
MNNFFQPSVQLQRKTRVGARRSRRYDAPQTPFDRLWATPKIDRRPLLKLRQLRNRLDPFALSEAIDRKLRRIFQLAHRGPITGVRHPKLHQRFELHPKPAALRAVGAAR